MTSFSMKPLGTEDTTQAPEPVDQTSCAIIKSPTPNEVGFVTTTLFDDACPVYDDVPNATAIL